MLRIGCVKYLNARPLIHGWEGDVDFDHPSALCNKLAAGELDIALVSSFEFLRNPIYRIVDDVSISSDGPVYSVVVAHSGEIDQIEEIELDPASETSVNLLRCLIAELGLTPRLVGAARPYGYRGGIKNRPSRATVYRRSSHPFPATVRERILFLGPRRTMAEIRRTSVCLRALVDSSRSRRSKAIADRLRKLRDENLANLDNLIAEL